MNLWEDKRLGFWLIELSSPYRRRAFNFIPYSSKIINYEVTSRNLEHRKVIRELKELLGDKSLVLDRELIYEDLFSGFRGYQFCYQIDNKPKIVNATREHISLLLSPSNIAEEHTTKTI